MKSIIIFTASIGFCLILFFYGCSNQQERDEAIARQEAARKDSNRREDSIQQVKIRKLIAEGRSRGYENAVPYINGTTVALAKNVAPFSYEQATYTIDSANAMFDLDTKTYSVPFHSDFMAFVHGPLVDSIKQWHSLYGKLTLYGTGEISWKVDSINTALREAENFNNELEEANNLLNKLSTKQEDQSSN